MLQHIQASDASGNRSGQAGTNNQLTYDGAAYYDYDAEGNRIKRTDIATDEVTRYEYDHRNRLISVRQMAPAEPLEDDGSGWGWGQTYGAGGPADPGPAWGERFVQLTDATGRTLTATSSLATEGSRIWINVYVSSGSIGDVQVSLVDHTATLNSDYYNLVITYQAGTLLAGYIDTVADLTAVAAKTGWIVKLPLRSPMGLGELPTGCGL